MRAVPAIATAAALAVSAIGGARSIAAELVRDRNLALLVVSRLDVTSFPLLIGPRRAVGKITFADYGFVPVKTDRDEVVLESPQHDWRFDIRVLKHHAGADRITICLRDRALSGTYDAQQALLLHAVGKSSRLVAEQNLERNESCPVFAR